MSAQKVRVHRPSTATTGVAGGGEASTTDSSWNSHIRIQREHNEVVEDLRLRAKVNDAGRLQATSGYRMVIGPWAQSNMVEGTAQDLPMLGNGALPTAWPAWRRGSVVGIGSMFSAALTGDSRLDMLIMVNDVEKKRYTILSTSAVNDRLVATLPRDQLKFLSRDRIEVRTITNDPPGWENPALDLTVWLEVEM